MHDYRRVVALVAALICIIATLLLADDSLVSIALNLAFWVSIIVVALGHVTPSRLGLFLPLTLLYYFTFYFNRELVEIWDKILNSDTPRYLEEAASFRVQARHLGFPIVTFPYVATNRLGSTLFGAPNLGREFLYLQLGFAGTMVATLIYTLVSDHQSAVSRWRRVRPLLVAYLFALSFAAWALSSVIDTFIVSTMILLMSLPDFRHYFLTGSTMSCVILALLTTIALSVSLENVYLIGLFGLTLTYQYICGHRQRIGIHCLLYTIITVVTFTLILQVAAVAGGPAFYRTSGDKSFPTPSTNIGENLYRFTRRFVDIEGTMSVRVLREVTFRVGVMAITAQQGTPVDQYGIDPKMLTTASTIVYFSLLLPVLVASAYGLVRRQPPEVRFAVIFLIGALTIRHLFLLIYARNENVLFAVPSLAGFWLLVGLGLNRYSDIVNHRYERVITTLLILLAVFLLMNNGYYLIHIT